jgi:hypothetical protein
LIELNPKTLPSGYKRQKTKTKGEGNKVKWNKMNKIKTHIPLDTCADVSYYRVQETFKTKFH